MQPCTLREIDAAFLGQASPEFQAAWQSVRQVTLRRGDSPCRKFGRAHVKLYLAAPLECAAAALVAELLRWCKLESGTDRLETLVVYTVPELGGTEAMLGVWRDLLAHSGARQLGVANQTHAQTLALRQLSVPGRLINEVRADALSKEDRVAMQRDAGLLLSHQPESAAAILHSLTVPRAPRALLQCSVLHHETMTLLKRGFLVPEIAVCDQGAR